MTQNFLLYGANGYTGEIVLRTGVERGLRPVIAGRNKTKIEELARKFDCESHVFALEETGKLEAVLSEVAAVLHCAGPFSLTSKPMVDACLKTGTHYLDITGEIAVFEAIAARNAEAEKAGVMVMPGVGFDVVPSDCLARHLKNRLPSATNLTLAFYGAGGKISHGTMTTMIMNIGNGGAIRRGGKIERVPAAWKTREFDFFGAKKNAVTIPWGDVSTAFYSTGIPNIEVFTVVPPAALRLMQLSRYVGWLLATQPAQQILQSQIQPGGASDAERERGKSFLYGEVSDDAGNRKAARLQTLEGYTLTALAALNIVEKVLSGNAPAGFQTPAKAYGADLVLEIEGTTREDLE